MTVALIMIMANQIISKRVEDVKGNVGNTISISPRGISGFEGGGNLLTEGDLKPISSYEHVTQVAMSLRARPSSTGLTSAIEPGTFGERFGQRAGPGGGGGRAFVSISVTGTNITGALPSSSLLGGEISLTSGRYFEASDASAKVAIVGKDLAQKNSLKIGSTFEMEGEKFKVVGIYDSGALFSNNAVYLPLKTTQKTFDLTNNVSDASVTVDSVSNVDTTVSKIESLLSDKADVTSEAERFTEALSPLESISQTTQVAVIGAIVAAVVIIFFSMLITVRQRIKEIGILKAIGASNFHLVTQFVTETMAVSLLAAVIASALSYMAGNAIVNNLVQPTTGGGRGGFAQGAGRLLLGLGGTGSLQVFNLETLAYALLIAIVVGILGSIIPALIASRLKPAEVIRLE